MRTGLLLAALLAPLGAQDIYDLLLKGGQVLDPKNGRNERLDIGISAGKIAKIAKGIPAAHARPRRAPMHEARCHGFEERVMFEHRQSRPAKRL